MVLARLPIIGVMGSGSEDGLPLAADLGRFLAQQPVHLLTGGGGGTMAAVSRAFYETPGRRGLVVGVLPCATRETPTIPKPGYPNPWVELPIRTHLPYSGERGEDPLSRNPINVLSADLVVALPGGAGTASEIRLAHAYGRPIIHLSPNSNPFIEKHNLTRANNLIDFQTFFQTWLAGFR
ncbi:SLOG cluster 4 domain-containing protein [Acanthopleuribacter pedis]|uniref:DNA-binding protein n=1 Tax=Acanthopleuribacter pedis TaxID=442870 RepID=A0A8J7U1D6_9BACT|nr:hypothetical protein [Acanthopleuribacter pedis]MBO1317417.1 hypothetical protein [Acanthopleuribacter pedis]